MSQTNLYFQHEKKTLKEAWRDTLAKSTVPDFFKRSGSRKLAIQHAASLTPSNGDMLGEPMRSKVGYSLNNSYQQSASTSTATSSKITSASVSSSVQNRPPASDYGTLKSGLLNNLKGYGRQ
jgi:hypothetical protein